MMELQKKLYKIQQELKAPKSQENKFGGFWYRSCEDILNAVKPLLDGCVLHLEDTLVYLGDHYYVKATASIQNADGECFTATAYAREAESRKGMDPAQITGAASSYARKYALNGLFCIDDTKDPDSQNNSGNNGKPTPTPQKNNEMTKPQREKLWSLCQENGLNEDWAKQFVGWAIPKRDRGTAAKVIENFSAELQDFYNSPEYQAMVEERL